MAKTNCVTCDVWVFHGNSEEKIGCYRVIRTSHHLSKNNKPMSMRSSWLQTAVYMHPLRNNSRDPILQIQHLGPQRVTQIPETAQKMAGPECVHRSQTSHSLLFTDCLPDNQWAACAADNGDGTKLTLRCVWERPRYSSWWGQEQSTAKRSGPGVKLSLRPRTSWVMLTKLPSHDSSFLKLKWRWQSWCLPHRVLVRIKENYIKYLGVVPII